MGMALFMKEIKVLVSVGYTGLQQDLEAFFFGGRTKAYRKYVTLLNFMVNQVEGHARKRGANTLLMICKTCT